LLQRSSPIPTRGPVLGQNNRAMRTPTQHFDQGNLGGPAPDVTRSRLPVQRLRHPSKGFGDEVLVGRDKRSLHPRDTAYSLSTASTSSGQSSWTGASEQQSASIHCLFSGGTLGRLRSVEPTDTPRCFDTAEDPTEVDEQPAAGTANGCDRPDGSYLRGISKVYTVRWFGHLVHVLSRSADGAKLPSVGICLNASKAETRLDMATLL